LCAVARTVAIGVARPNPVGGEIDAPASRSDMLLWGERQVLVERVAVEQRVEGRLQIVEDHVERQALEAEDLAEVRRPGTGSAKQALRPADGRPPTSP